MTYIAIDVHKKSSTFAILVPSTGEMIRRQVPTKRLRFDDLLSKLPRPWVVAIEATRESPSVCAWLQEWDADVHLVDPQTLSALGKLRLAKTDLKDAELMLHALVHQHLPECYLAPEAVVEHRALTRGHTVLREISTQLRNLVRVALCHHGLECSRSDLTAKAALEAVPELVAQLPPLARLVAGQFWQLLLAVEKSLQTVDHAIEEVAEQDPVAQTICQHPGLGPITALGIMAEIGDISRFPKAKKLHSYAGWAPRTYQSGDFCVNGPLSDRCNKRLRYWVGLAAQGAARAHMPSKAKAAYERVKLRRNANTAKTVASREMLSFVYYTWIRMLAPPPAPVAAS